MKIALVAFQGEVMCFAHVLLNALDMHGKGHEVSVIIEGAACKLIPLMIKEETPFAKQYAEVVEKGLICAVCKACSSKMGTLADVEAQGLVVAGEMSGHPSLEPYIASGHNVITF
jgi:hypothetical protein